jgi:hypothetical protein
VVVGSLLLALVAVLAQQVALHPLQLGAWPMSYREVIASQPGALLVEEAQCCCTYVNREFHCGYADGFHFPGGASPLPFPFLMIPLSLSPLLSLGVVAGFRMRVHLMVACLSQCSSHSSSRLALVDHLMAGAHRMGEVALMGVAGQMAWDCH